MNDTIIKGFIKRAALAGASVEQIKELASHKFGSIKQAEAKTEVSLDSVVTSLLKNASLNKTAGMTGFVHGLLTEAISAGANFEQAIKIAEVALSESKKLVVKEASAVDNNKLELYATEFLKAASEAGYSETEARQQLDHVLTIKQANGMDMFKPGMPMPGDQSQPPVGMDAGAAMGGQMGGQDQLAAMMGGAGADPAAMGGGADPAMMAGQGGGNDIEQQLLAALSAHMQQGQQPGGMPS